MTRTSALYGKFDEVTDGEKLVLVKRRRFGNHDIETILDATVVRMLSNAYVVRLDDGRELKFTLRHELWGTASDTWARSGYHVHRAAARAYFEQLAADANDRRERKQKFSQLLNGLPRNFNDITPAHVENLEALLAYAKENVSKD